MTTLEFHFSLQVPTFQLFMASGNFSHALVKSFKLRMSMFVFLASFVVVVDIKVTILSTQKSLFCFSSLKGRDYGGKEKSSSLYMVFINKASKLIGTNF